MIEIKEYVGHKPVQVKEDKKRKVEKSDKSKNADNQKKNK